MILCLYGDGMFYPPFGEMTGFENMIGLNVSENAELLRTDGMRRLEFFTKEIKLNIV